MSKICGYSCKHNKSGVCQISGCDKKSIILGYAIVPNSDIKSLLYKLQQENKILKENAEHNNKVVDKVNWENRLLKKENQQLKEQLLVAQTNEETFRLEMEDITKTLGLDEDTIFDDVKVCVKNLKDNWNKLKEYLFDIRKRGFALQNLANVTKNTEPNIAILIIINKLQELEQGSDSNE